MLDSPQAVDAFQVGAHIGEKRHHLSQLQSKILEQKYILFYWSN